MKAISIIFSLMLSLGVLAGPASAQRSQPICEDAHYLVRNNSNHDIKVVDVEYKDKWVRFPSTRNRVIEAGERTTWQRDTPGLAYSASTRARIIYKSRKGGKWVLQETKKSLRTYCFGYDTFLIFDVKLGSTWWWLPLQPPRHAAFAADRL